MGPMTTWIWLIIMVAVFYFLIIRPQKKREKQERALRNSVQPGDEIITIGGFFGKVLSVKEDSVTFESGADRTKITVKKWAIQTRTSPVQETNNSEPAVAETSTEDSSFVLDGEAIDNGKKKKKKLFSKNAE